MLEEMKNPWNENASHVKEFIYIDTHDVLDEDGKVSYRHVENLCIWSNGFYEFNSFNFTNPSMRGKKSFSSPSQLDLLMHTIEGHCAMQEKGKVKKVGSSR